MQFQTLLHSRPPPLVNFTAQLASRAPSPLVKRRTGLGRPCRRRPSPLPPSGRLTGPPLTRAPHTGTSPPSPLPHLRITPPQYSSFSSLAHPVHLLARSVGDRAGCKERRRRRRQQRPSRPRIRRPRRRQAALLAILPTGRPPRSSPSSPPAALRAGSSSFTTRAS
jgi:hypothetical protein